MIERLIHDGRIIGELKLPYGADINCPEFRGDVVTERIRGKGYSGGHNTAARLGWQTYHPIIPDGVIAHWDDTEEGRFTGYDPAEMIVLPFSLESVAKKFVADLQEMTRWDYSRQDYAKKFADRLKACVANGVKFTIQQSRVLRDTGLTSVLS